METIKSKLGQIRAIQQESTNSILEVSRSIHRNLSLNNKVYQMLRKGHDLLMKSRFLNDENTSININIKYDTFAYEIIYLSYGENDRIILNTFVLDFEKLHDHFALESIEPNDVFDQAYEEFKTFLDKEVISGA